MTRPPVVVTGATGFVGRAICARLQAEGFGVLACARHRVPGPWDDFAELDVAHAAGATWPVSPGSIVVHAAGLAHDTAGVGFTDADYDEVNSGGAAAAAEAVVACGGAGLILLSSVKAMADCTGPIPLTQDAACHPTTAYGRSKYEGERRARSVLRGAAPLAVLRLAPVYGAGTKGNLDRLVRIARRRWMPLLPKATGQRSMIHVDDVADLVTELVSRPRTLDLVVADGQRYSVRAIQDQARSKRGTGTVLDRIWARMVIPAVLLRMLGTVGSLGRRATGRRMPFTSDDARRLLDDALYGSEVPADLHWRPVRTLWDFMDSPP